ncbi:expressed unknown protein [Ectocarpus siliculosus]|uniref:Uncharacterized protein n=1 Tax=Ectocarpus siliculosus TaxID=2880 RepID=D8LFT8_ECTSI|nr:expressed unknown protein [Ectocarpus siliculosus]|eukprot:CBN75662.1 expressed unknown protein [Ectocarpus siliculosus]
MYLRNPLEKPTKTDQHTLLCVSLLCCALLRRPALRCLTRERTTCEAAAKSNGVTTRGWSSSGFATPGGDAGAAEMPGLPSAFPWREATDNRGMRGLVERAMYSVMQHQHRRFLRAATKLDDADDDAFLATCRRNGVRPGGRRGLPDASASGYRTPHQRGGRRRKGVFGIGGPREEKACVYPTLYPGDGLPVWDIPEGALVDPRDVMHKDLAEFYVQAAVAAKVSRSTPFYRLHGFTSCEISNVNVLWGAQRGDLPEEGETIEIWGSKYVLKSVLEDIKAISRYRVNKDRAGLDKPLSSIRKTTVQVDVDIGCTETFFVSDNRTEEVVDLDNWMKGNTFW